MNFTLDVAINRFDEKIKSSRAFTISKYTKFSAFSTQQFQPVFRRRRLDRSSILAKCATEHKRIKKKFCRVNKEISFHLTVPPTIITTPQHSYIYTIYIYISRRTRSPPRRSRTSNSNLWPFTNFLVSPRPDGRVKVGFPFAKQQCILIGHC